MSLIAIILLVLIFCAIYIGIVWFAKYNSSRHWSSIPGFCMGIGIGITFLSMYRTFQNFKKGNEIENLIPEISSAFIGSLLGLSISLLMTYWIKSRIAAIEEIEQKQAGEDANPYLLLQKIAKNTENLNTAFATFNTKTEQFNTNLFKELIQKLEKVVKDTGSNAIKQSLQNLDDINTQLSGKVDEIEAIVSGFGDNISDKISEVLAAKIQNLEATFERIEKYQRRSETILKEATHKFGKSVTQVEYINDRRKEEFDQLEKQSKTLDETIQTTNQVYDNWKETIGSITEMETKLASINNVIINIDKLNSKFQDYFPSTQQNLNNDVQ